MSRVLVTERYLSEIAAAIRAKLGVETAYRPGQMAAAIESISGDGSAEGMRFESDVGASDVPYVDAAGEYAPGAWASGAGDVTADSPAPTSAFALARLGWTASAELYVEA